MEIKIRGTIVPDDYADVYDWLGIAYTAPKQMTLPEDGKEEVLVDINSYGGDVYAGSEIYTALKSYPGKVTVKISGIAASMASVIAMAGDRVTISPTGQLMIHCVSTFAEGNKADMQKAAEVLESFDRTIVNAYRIKTGIPEEELLQLMAEETWLTPKAAKDKGFVDEVLFDEAKESADGELEVAAAAPGVELLSRAQVAILKAKMEEKKDMKNSLYKDEADKIVDEEEKVEEEETKEEEEKKKEEAPEEENGEEETEEEDGKEETEEDDDKEDDDEDGEEDDKKEDVSDGAIDGVEAKSRQEFTGGVALRPENRIKRFENEANPKNLKNIGGMEMKKNYRDAFLAAVRGYEVTDEEQVLINQENARFFGAAFTHDTTNTALVIPRTTQDKIWSRALSGYGVFEDVVRMHVPGELRMVKHTGIEAGDAKWYVESTTTEDEKNAFSELILKGHELSKAVTISWKLRAMAMDDFEAFLIRELGDRIAVALGNAVTNGSGTNEPKGIVTVLKEAGNAAQVANVAKANVVTYSELVGAIAKVHSSYKSGAKIYANSNVIWTVLANVVDGQGRPFFLADKSEDGVGQALGFVVKEDASLADDQILIGNPAQGYVFNVNEEMSMTTEDHAKERRTDYVVYMIADGNVIDEKAFALLSLTVASSTGR